MPLCCLCVSGCKFTCSCVFHLNISRFCVVQPMPKGDHVLNFSDAEDMINDKDLVYVLIYMDVVYHLRHID